MDDARLDLELDRWVSQRAAVARRLMPQFDELPSEIRKALANMTTGPKWSFIQSIHASVKRGTRTSFLVRKIAREDEARIRIRRVDGQ